MVRISCLVLALFFGCALAGPVQDHSKDEEHRMHPELKDPEAVLSSRFKVADEEKDASYWQNNGKERVMKILQNELNLNKAKNVILFIGDGMSITTLAASRMYMGQLVGESGEEAELSFEKFPTAGLSKTYCIDRQVPDSACTATAYLTGIKANYGTIGVSGHVPRYDCVQMQNTSYYVDSIAKRFMDKGRSAGIVTTTRITHASPSGAYAHTANRDWEADSDVISSGFDPLLCRDIAHQLIHGDTGKDFQVILGGGRREFRSSEVADEEGVIGKRADNRNLIDEWIQQKSEKDVKYNYVWNREQLKNVDETNNTDYLLGLFEADHCKYHLDAVDSTTEPTFEDMVESAINVLSKNENGFFLFAEGGRIDHAHHDVLARKAVDETVEFSKGIAKAVSMTSEYDTLIVVTSDHAHTMTMSGYPSRGNPILGPNNLQLGDDGIKYMTLSYANGMGYRPEVDGQRIDVTQEDMESLEFQYPALVPLDSETHGGEDVGVFAHGPWNHLFTGVSEQHTIPHLMSYAACIDDDLSAC